MTGYPLPHRPGNNPRLLRILHSPPENEDDDQAEDSSGLPLNIVLTKPNYALLLQKFQPWRPVTDNIWAIRGHKDRKGEYLRDIANKYRVDKDILSAYASRWEAAVKANHAHITTNHELYVKPLKTASRLVVGLGTESTLETSITLHRLHGFPYIPASALKGLCHAVCLLALAKTLGIPPTPMERALQALRSRPPQSLDPGIHTLAVFTQDVRTSQLKAYAELSTTYTLPTFEELEQHQDIQRFRRIFGTVERAGDVVFFDGIPTGNQSLIEADVLSPHFGEYYMHNGDPTQRPAPSDDQSPVPTIFLVVPEGRTFHFAVGVRRNMSNDADAVACTELAQAWLWLALQEFGIGAKTAAGYGYFTG